MRILILLQCDVVLVGAAEASGTFCGNDSYYCPPGSSEPTVVDPGFYATGSLGARSGQALCLVGHYCIAGSLIACPSGTFGNVTGLTSPACSGRCDDGGEVAVILLS